MSEGPEVRRAADKIAEAVLGRSIIDLQCKFMKNDMREKIIGSKVLSVDTYGKNIILHFSSNIYLRNHMMMWGKWRIYTRTEYDSGKAKPPVRVKWKKKLNSKTPFVFFQFLVVKPNEHQIEEIKLLAKEIGVDQVRFKTAQIYDYENDPNNLLTTLDKYSRYRKNKAGKMEIKSGLQNHCWRLWSANVITWDGLVVPCCFDKDATHQLGNLKTQSFKETWQNDNYKQFRRELMTSRKNIDICANCSEGLKVWEE